ncbi:uncharacterized protein LOC110433970 isoform X2 [Sorghum bicolor]|uniref:uncharacterized protein LOC110433970 isoform X2 n=1 Tax=Sorghum bicolor TaxID=4558 RepID=UPI000B423ACB|nr:uncharacterized protein LOC110433970 isoform X2 [Sorghum bicolor]|eukprot:XP_021312925.1 uncharacterized protein LOC110433970 isoform X2 [Sorghum bicolor]
MAPPPRVTPSPDRDSTTRDIAASALCDALATCETLRHRDIASSRPRLHPPQSRSVTTEPTPPDAAASMITVAAPTQRSRIARNKPNHTVFEENITYASKVPLKRNTYLCLACAGDKSVIMWLQPSAI